MFPAFQSPCLNLTGSTCLQQKETMNHGSSSLASLVPLKTSGSQSVWGHSSLPSSPAIDLKLLYPVVCLLPSAKWNQTVYAGESHNTSIARDGLLVWPITLIETDLPTRDKWAISADNRRWFIGGYRCGWRSGWQRSTSPFARSVFIGGRIAASIRSWIRFISQQDDAFTYCIWYQGMQNGVVGVLPGAKGIFLL